MAHAQFRHDTGIGINDRGEIIEQSFEKHASLALRSISRPKIWIKG
ncbi:hypothetical protein SAMN05216325_11323 [Nitrosomonas marina]|uniref:Uncharacterized protein n=1 Tax=Nitrosomonas marina TaxID=917 RepID=A0A1H8FGM4_9PROT|nr:hypothetical protein SAMN05216325_11323 [Nitrosomonas marina]